MFRGTLTVFEEVLPSLHEHKCHFTHVNINWNSTQRLLLEMCDMEQAVGRLLTELQPKMHFLKLEFFNCISVCKKQCLPTLASCKDSG